MRKLAPWLAAVSLFAPRFGLICLLIGPLRMCCYGAHFWPASRFVFGGRINRWIKWPALTHDCYKCLGRIIRVDPAHRRRVAFE